MYLTNALTGWGPSVQKPLPLPELEEERDRGREGESGDAGLGHPGQSALQRLCRCIHGRRARALLKPIARLVE